MLHQFARRTRPLLLVSLAATFLVTACGTAPTATTGSAASARASAVPGERKEVTLVKSPRPYIANTVAALEKGDVAAAKAAFAPYDGAWNGVEVYVNFRSLDLYKDIESNWQAKITAALNAPQPNAAEILPMAKAMLAKYDEAIALVQKGPALSPLFDDVADLRIARAPLREVAPALAAGNLPKAKESWGTFGKAWPGVSSLIKLRSEQAYGEVSQAIAQAETAWQKPQPSAAELTPLVATVMARFNYGLSLVNAAARGADLTKKTYAPEEAKAAAGLRRIQAQFKASLASWNSGNYVDAAAKAGQAAGPMLSDSAVAAPLQARALDGTLKSALDGYASISGAAGDAAKVTAANKAAVEAMEVAIQSLVGQFWTDPQVQATVGKAA